jgi:putative transposase
MQLEKHAVDVMLEGEFTEHLGYELIDPVGNGSWNSRNGRSVKKVQSKDGEMALEVPRDRDGVATDRYAGGDVPCAM